MKAKVYKSTGSWYTVKDENGKIQNARLKGIFKIDEITSTNPVSVGDDVKIEKEIPPEMISGEIDRIANNYVRYADWFRNQ